MWVSKREVPEIEPSISFLCIRLTKRSMEDKSKLKRVLKLLQQTTICNSLKRANDK